jgi:Ran GTPase-activating protein (RanGAP) involved in mRNA processing and transport
MCSALAPYTSYLEDIDLRFNEIGDLGARALGDLLSRANRLLGLNLQGNKIKSEGAQYLAESLRECTGL